MQIAREIIQNTKKAEEKTAHKVVHISYCKRHPYIDWRSERGVC